ncbi:winged helix-turn-helix transcriptional regulator [Saccharopolyspora thermophila]|uniref:winged helix-turn-helix transcriptional regulator n=1 Tax=Saccharopolyspora thermophila TaxID=89367 RepID=UPI001E4B0697|nr:winged helix-turn-helix transcriptional regulator [Saccharopolyspora subtropica]
MPETEAGLAARDQWVKEQLDNCPITVVDIDSLLPADSPRSSGVDAEHTHALAEGDDELPPIVVHGPTMRVIDGMHRLASARARKQRTIEARIYDGDDRDAFVLAVRLNVTHGLPLSRADRAAAAARIVVSHPHWSNRMIATMTGIAPATVGRIRKRSTGQAAQSDTRVGQDGRVRPLNASAGRQRAFELLIQNPDASLREVARQAGVSPATVHDVRRRLQEGEEPTPARQRRGSGSGGRGPEPRPAAGSATPHSRLGVILADLKKDPALRFNQKGRSLLRWLDRHFAGMNAWRQVIFDIPAHRRDTIAEFLRIYASAWTELADDIKETARNSAENTSETTPRKGFSLLANEPSALPCER